MAKGYKDFSEYATIAEVLADWTPRLDAASTDFALASGVSLAGGKGVRVTRTGVKLGLLSLNEIDAQSDRADVELYLSYYFQSLGNSGDQATYAAGRINGTSRSNGNFYGVQATDWGNYQRIYQRANGSPVTLASTALTLVLEKMHSRVRINGSTIQTKVWASPDPEPELWHLEVTNTDITTAGWAGLGFGVFASQFDDVIFDEFGWATGGEIAPTGPVTTGPATPINLGAINILTTSARLTWERG